MWEIHVYDEDGDLDRIEDGVNMFDLPGTIRRILDTEEPLRLDIRHDSYERMSSDH